MPKKKPSKFTSAVEVSTDSDLARLRDITRLLLKKLEEAMHQAGSDRADDQPPYDWLFGTKHSLVSTLVTLTDLILRLDNAQALANKQNVEAGVPAPGISMNASDIALVEDFLRKAALILILF